MVKIFNFKNFKDYVQNWTENQKGELDEPPLLNKKSSYDATLEEETKQIIDIINRHNVKLVLAKKVKLTIGCLVR